MAVETGISSAAVFIQGILSFLSPCVLPLLPVYMGYLSGGTLSNDIKQGFERKRVLVNTLFFEVPNEKTVIEKKYEEQKKL